MEVRLLGKNWVYQFAPIDSGSKAAINCPETALRISEPEGVGNPARGQLQK